MKFPRLFKIALAGLLIAVASLPQTLCACAACYGESDSPMAKGMNRGIFSLLAIVGGVLGGISLFFVHIGRKAAAQDDGSTGNLPNTKD